MFGMDITNHRNQHGIGSKTHGVSFVATPM